MLVLLQPLTANCLDAEEYMGSVTQLVFPGALIGSATLALFAFMATASMTPPAATSASAPVVAALQDAAAVEPTPAQESKPAPVVEFPAEVVLDSAPAVAQVQEPTQENAAASQPVATEPPEDPKQAQESKDPQEKCKVSQKYPDKILQWCDLISKFAKKNGLDPDLLAALIWQESGGNPTAYSQSGAVGLMQVMPRDGIAAGFMCVNGPCFTNRPTIAELEDPSFNLKYGTAMLTNLLSKYEDMREALRYYGPRDSGYYYADKVLGIYENYRK
jgi:soluble lytic murein transglycosylase-like protein